MRDRAEVVIVGAGIMGLAIAYNLARHHGVTDIVVLDRGYLCGGASGRNGGGVRAQFSSADNIQLMQESIRLCRDFAQEMKINIWFRQGGYLFLVRSEEGRRMLERSVAVQNEHGLGTRMLLPIEAQRIVPELSTEGVVAASFNPDDGVVFPWPFVWGYAHAAEKLGVEIATFTQVTGFRTQGPRITSVLTDRGEIRTRKVINAAGAWSPEIARMLGVELPNRPHRHEICSTEPLKLWLGPLVSDLSNGLYFSQSMRGEIVGGISNEDVPPGLDMGSSHRFLALYGRALTRICPILGSVKVLRQWAGCYDLTPDQNPIVGRVDEIEHFYQASGFMGHGFMMAPVMGRLLAEVVAGGPETPLFLKWNLRRFKEGRLLTESMIIG
ncbi:NAD(P)/FAD-dependent oxidoreductase [Chondromyces crocatus]|uniref:Sarcosine oxidase subunit beta n=1 Tax=Chondromyces crocatus TaxID=52 RepID=A0A0K1EA10_CHOCO|nr:FAD-binding oxidoreductase [Chondromyces crocatus]AKT37700.1 sarcosine oxidase subunit beta [Chondromyces crocatus]